MLPDGSHGAPAKKQPARASRQRGSTVAEFAWVFPLLLITLGAIWDFGRAMYAYHFIANAARQGARWASVRGSSSFEGCPTASTPCPATAAQIQSYVQSLAPPGMYYNSGATLGQTGFLGINSTSAPSNPCSPASASNFPWPGCGADGTVNTSGASNYSQYSPCSPLVISPNAGPNNPGCLVSVQVEYSYNFFLLNAFYKLVPGKTGPGTITLVSTDSAVITQ